MFVDFHMHTTCSDGNLTPQKIIEAAKAANISYMAITDHDDIRAFQEVVPADLGRIKLISGIEFSSYYKEEKVHILGYNFDPYNKAIEEYCHFFKNERQQRIEKMVKKCFDLGYEITYEELKELFPGQTNWGRPHVGKLLVKKGYVSTVQEAFDLLLGDGKPGYVEKYKITPSEVIHLVHQAGGLVVLAHPILIHNDVYVEELLELPFDGIEVYHPKQMTDTLLQKYLKMAEARSLLITGGSDYHAIEGRYPENLDEMKITPNLVEAFINRVFSK